MKKILQFWTKNITNIKFINAIYKHAIYIYNLYLKYKKIKL